MLRTYVFNGGRLVCVETGSETLDGISETPVWLDLLNPTHEEGQAVARRLAITLPTREEMQDIEASARLYSEDGAEFMTITVISRLDSHDPESSQITFVLKSGTLLTLRYVEPRAFANFITRVQKPFTVACATGEQVMLGLIEALSARIADALELVGRDLDGISRAVFRQKERDLEQVVERIGHYGDLLGKLRESVVTITRLLTYHSAIDASDKKATKEARIRGKTLHRDAISISDQAAFLSNKINFLLDATLGLISVQQSKIIKIFSVAAVVFLPPTMVASIYGMNFANMPELHWGYGYPFALGLMALSAIVPYLYFKRRRWL